MSEETYRGYTEEQIPYTKIELLKFINDRYCFVCEELCLPLHHTDTCPVKDNPDAFSEAFTCGAYKMNKAISKRRDSFKTVYREAVNT